MIPTASPHLSSALDLSRLVVEVRGRPPSLPFCRDDAALAAVRAFPPRDPKRAAIHRSDPNTPCKSAGT
jgi:hypothetical protein